MLTVLSLRRPRSPIPKRYTLVRDAESCPADRPTLVVDPRFADLERAFAFARRVDLNADKKIYVPVRRLSRLAQWIARVYNLCMGSNLQDPFAGFFITKQSHLLQSLGHEPVFFMLDVLVTHIKDEDEIANIEV